MFTLTYEVFAPHLLGNTSAVPSYSLSSQTTTNGSLNTPLDQELSVLTPIGIDTKPYYASSTACSPGVRL